MRTKLLQEIESCRNQMISIAASTSLTDEEVLKLSKELDVLLNQYQKYEETLK
ncbi:aspartyl-phosphate phosphatase Spo0E family protein [Robertmurraya sp. DFI.2.37]|uniref:aspartyl-phosphate phosphatase Spo0E family protein n=1 Tax=Robertmurraya sp. DFI.2.37 TaxID=3031819 RepID=UPI0012480BCC|nr:aspartyl-phosphate phosphatase Spo0E family protein [Robertmurraya sp. DFI.2.37]MDF1511395.1 aspartyl-phosphate phosphatase Spo0E family protein [Robertmurraya sp. DFI.2.37]